MRARTIQSAALLTALAMMAAPEAVAEPEPKPKRPVEDDEERIAEAQRKRELRNAKRVELLRRKRP